MGWFRRLRDNDSGIFFRDFAGSTVVHTVGGVIALAGASCSDRVSAGSSSVMAVAQCRHTTSRLAQSVA